ncbi:hypothetical protein [Aquabacterium sp.]|uniref:hypothetical protein n=1 Tax=Aquabacterium sp. TaxID=1872578 RepID=UPI0035B43A56
MHPARNAPTCPLWLRWLAMLGWLVAHAGAVAGPLLVVVPDTSPIQALSRQELIDIYLDLNSARVAQQAMPLDRSEDGLRERFYQSLGVSPSAVRAHWAKRVFTGRGRPPPVVSSASLGATLAQERRALIYLDATERPRNTRVVITLD